MEVQTFPGHRKVATSAAICATKIAYFILVHRLPQQFKRMFKAIYHPGNYYLIHLDEKADPATAKEVKQFLTNYPNAYIMESEKVVWGGYSMVQAELNGMNYLLSQQADWDYFINLSGQDFPLRSQAYIQDFLAKDKSLSYIKIANQQEERPDTLNRIENYFTETYTGFAAKTHKRAYMHGVTPYIGGQWMILSRACCTFLCNSTEVKKFENYYLNTLIADESFFQTVLMNTSFDGGLVNDDKRAIIWVPDGLIKLRPKTFTMDDIDFLLQGDNLFARKFDDNVDGTILNTVEANIAYCNAPTQLSDKMINCNN
jgi:hypothetical protein